MLHDDDLDLLPLLPVPADAGSDDHAAMETMMDAPAPAPATAFCMELSDCGGMAFYVELALGCRPRRV